MATAAASVGLSSEKVIVTISKLTGVISQAADGSDRYIKALHSIGLSWVSLKRMRPEEQFAVIASQLSKLQKAGHDIPEIFRSVMGDETMRTLLQAGDGFQKNLLLNQMGTGISDEAVKHAQGMVAGFERMGKEWTDWVSQMGMTTWALERLEEASNKAADKMAEKNYYSTNGTFMADTMEGIDDVVKRNEWSREEKIEAIAHADNMQIDYEKILFGKNNEKYAALRDNPEQIFQVLKVVFHKNPELLKKVTDWSNNPKFYNDTIAKFEQSTNLEQSRLRNSVYD